MPGHISIASVDEPIEESYVDDEEHARRVERLAERGLVIGSYVVIPGRTDGRLNSASSQVTVWQKPSFVADSVLINTTDKRGMLTYVHGSIVFFNFSDTVFDFALVLLSTGQLWWFIIGDAVKSLDQFMTTNK